MSHQTDVQQGSDPMSQLKCHVFIFKIYWSLNCLFVALSFSEATILVMTVSH